VGSEEGCGGGYFERGGDAGVAAARAGGGGGGARSGFRLKTKGGRLIWRAHLSVRGGARGRLGPKGEEGRWAAAGPKIRNGPKFWK
jgi:hypothetical protein